MGMSAIALVLLALLGHAFFCVAAVNRLHARNLPQWFIKGVSAVCYLVLGLLPLALGWGYYQGDLHWPAAFNHATFSDRSSLAATTYLALCCLAAIMTMVEWVGRHVLSRPPEVLRSLRRQKLALQLEPTPGNEADHAHHVLVRLPGNESLQLDLVSQAIDVPRLPPALEGLSIVHFSDLHFTGRMGKAYFQEVVRAQQRVAAGPGGRDRRPGR